ncbi:MAG: prepilin-type N-terminal cleavage/methylation domain-containing protein [Clostridia bacterium]|jgi:prepilin-type N-terminal cleavage/methylation domain-containing protein|nr:prepilin-type N-terminal cleavage/methylation domain-containing protein [Clostridia bacterium]MCI2014919.1 prepilin-type N-terminal cleavage/methylation domain-containing protein [Clostridia bacterium]
MLASVKKHIANKSGFTLGEILIVVAILSIIAAIAIPSAIYIRNKMHQTTLDNTAREIFITAQNKLSGLKSCGLDMPEGKTMGKDEPTDFSETGLEWTNTGNSSDAYVYCASYDENFHWLDDTSYAPKDTDGEYIIELNRLTGDVYSVFYWDFNSGPYGKGSFEYPKDYNVYTDKNGNEYSLRENKSNRMKIFVGYYGSNGSFSSDIKTFDYSLLIKNEDRLSVSITPDELSVGMNTEYNIEISSATDTSNQNKYTYQIEYKNGAAYAGGGNNLTDMSTAYPNVTADITDFSFDIVLDSLEGNKHFANLYPKIKAGDDIKVTVNAMYIGSKGMYAQKEPKHGEANSLFDGLRQNSDGSPNTKGNTVQIANGRHLQNMAYEISNLGRTSDGNITPYTIKSAVLNNDIDWSDYNGINTKWTSTEPLNSFYPISNIYADTSNPITYGMNTGITSFDGKLHEIKNLNVAETKTLTDAITKSDNLYNNKNEIENRAASGLFAFMYNVGTIKDFTLSNAYVKNDFSDTSYKTGVAALCGFVSTTLNSKNKNGTIDKSTAGTIENVKFIDCTVTSEIANTGMAAGCISLLGNKGSDNSDITDGLYIKKCGSYLDDDNSDKYYKKDISSNPDYAVKSTNGNAGGIVGFLEYGVAQITDSFSAVNVYAYSNAGGIIGLSDDKLQINNCYSSCDVKALSLSDGNTGGIAGKIGGGWIKLDNCLTTCDVNGEHYSGGAFGWIDISENMYTSSVSVSNCLSYGTVTWKNNEVCQNSSNLTLSGACSGGFVGRIESSALNKSSFDMKTNCRYLSMNGYNDSNPVSSKISGYGYDYSDYSNKINILPSLYENDSSGNAYMPPASLSALQQKRKTHPYISELKNTAFPFELIKASDNSVLDYYGNWPQKRYIETALCYYEKYTNGSDTKYGFYATATMGAGQPEWTLDTLMSQKDLSSSGFYLTEDGYALISSYDIGQFNYVFDSANGTICVTDGDATKNEAGKIISGTKLEFANTNSETLTMYANVYKLPFFFQETDKDKSTEFYDKFDISYTSDKKYDESGNLKDISAYASENNPNWPHGKRQVSDNYTFYYCCHFSKTAINPYIGRTSAVMPETISKVYVRSPRQLNALGRYCCYWNSINGNFCTFIQELDLNFSTYTKAYCGVNYNMSPKGNYQNMPIGGNKNDMPYSFQNNYNGQNKKIINFKIDTESLHYVGLFGEISGTIKNINMCVDDKIAKEFNDYSEYGSGYIKATFTYGKLKALPGNTDHNQNNNYILGALVGNVSDNSLIQNCSVSGYTILGQMSSEKICVNSSGETVEINKFPNSSDFYVGGLVGLNGDYVLNCTSENKLVKFIYAHPYTDNNFYGQEKNVGGLAGSNQGVIDGCYAGGTLQIDSDNSASYGIETAKNDFYIGGVAGTNCCTGNEYGETYSNSVGTYKGTLIADSYSFCSIQKSGSANSFVPSGNIYGIAYTTDKNTSLDDYKNSCNNVSENIANCYFLNESVNLGKDNPADFDFNMENSLKAGIYYDKMSDIPDYSEVLNSGIKNAVYNISNSDISPNLFSTIPLPPSESYPYSDNLSGRAYPFPAAVENDGNYVHYGNWPLHKNNNIGLCYYEKYGDGSTGLYIYGIDTEKYSGGDPNSAETAGTWFVNTLKYENGPIVTENGYLLAAQGNADVSGLEKASAPTVNGYSFYKISASQNTDGIVKTTLPNTSVSAFYNPNFASSIRLGTLNNYYANQFDSYQIRTISEFENINSYRYNKINFEQTINITTSKTYDTPYIIPDFNGTYDGKGRRDDGIRENISIPDESYKITFTSPLTFDVYKISKTICSGIFGINHGTLKNMDVSGSMVCSYENSPYDLLIGGITGLNESDSYGNSGNVICCKVDMNISLENKSNHSGLGMTCIGGLIGKNTSDGSCFGNASFGKVAYNSNIKMNNGQGNSLYIGGFVGYNGNYMSANYSTGSVCENAYIKEGKLCAAGGFAGANYGKISACYSIGNVFSAIYNCGQFAGICSSALNSCYGWEPDSGLGFYGINNSALFKNCYCYNDTVSETGIIYMPSWNQSTGNLKDSDIEQTLNLHWKYDTKTLTPVFAK